MKFLSVIGARPQFIKVKSYKVMEIATFLLYKTPLALKFLKIRWS